MYICKNGNLGFGTGSTHNQKRLKRLSFSHWKYSGTNMLEKTLENSILRCLSLETSFSPWYSYSDLFQSKEAEELKKNSKNSELKLHEVRYFPSITTGNDLPKRKLDAGDAFCLSDLFFCESCSRVLSNNPVELVEEVESYYCPHSLENMPSQEAMLYSNKSSRAFSCPLCQNVLTIVASSKSHVLNKSNEDNNRENSESLSENVYYLLCNHCRWDSIDVALYAQSPSEIMKVALEQEQKIAERFNIKSIISRFNDAHAKRNEKCGNEPGGENIFAENDKGIQDNVAPIDKDGPWRWEHVERMVKQKDLNGSKSVQRLDLIECENCDSDNNDSFEGDQAAFSQDPYGDAEGYPYDDVEGHFNLACLSSVEQRLRNPVTQPYSTNRLYPQRIDLRIKRSLRCRKCLHEGKANIIIKGQINPLKGDSSMRTNVGSWYKKNSFAYDYLPRITALSVSDQEPTEYQNTQNVTRRSSDKDSAKDVFRTGSDLGLVFVITNPLEQKIQLDMNLLTQLDHDKMNTFDTVAPEDGESENPSLEWHIKVDVEAFDELDEFDHQLWSSRTLSKIESRDEGDHLSRYLVGRWSNKVVVSFPEFSELKKGSVQDLIFEGRVRFICDDVHNEEETQDTNNGPKSYIETEKSDFVFQFLVSL